jgi:undecaprenyl-phosphate 4-deoxy-4-formamido-L-arabinose transferase
MERIQDERRTRSLSIVVPVYRSEATLPELHRRLTAALDEFAQEYEVILVDDGSDDGSWRAIRSLVSQDPRVRGIRLGRNAGQHNALLCGIRAARYPVTVTLDDDLQNPPEEIPTLLAALDEGHDVVYGAPLREQHGLLRDLASRLTKIALQDVMGSENARHVSAFRVFRTRLRDAFVDYSNPFVSIDVLLTYGTDRFGHVQVRHDARAAGQSSYTLRKLVVHAMNMMTGFTTIPLQLASIAGFLCALLGVLVLAYVLVTWLAQGSVVPGFAFLASMVAIFSGVQLFALGIVGEYLGRIHVSTTARPPYLVRDRAGDQGVVDEPTMADPTPGEREEVYSGLGGP